MSNNNNSGVNLNERFTSELATFTQNLPHFVRSISVDGDNFMILRLKYTKPFEEVLVHFDDSFRTHYPNGNITFVINREIKGMPAAAAPTFARICSTLSSLALTSTGAGGDILKMFPITQEEQQRYQDEKERQQNVNHHQGSGMLQRSGMMGSRSGSHATMMLGGGVGGGRQQSRWIPQSSMEADLSLEAAKLNPTLTNDVEELAKKLSSANGQHQPAIIDVQNLEAGQVAISFTVPIDEVAKLFVASTIKSNKIVVNQNNNNTLPKPTIYEQREFNKMLEALDLNRDEAFTWRITVDPVQYPQGFSKIEFGQASNFAKGVFPGAVGHLRRILSSLIRTYQRILSGGVDATTISLLLEGFGEEEIVAAIKAANNDANRAAAELRKEFGTQIGSSTSSASAPSTNASKVLQAKRIPRPNECGLLLACVDTVINRFNTLSDFCCICDRTHVFASGNAGMVGSTVCTRGSCQFRFSKLDVAKDVASQSAMQTGVMDLLIIMAKFAASSSRWTYLLDPFPTLVDSSGKTVCSPANKNIDLCKQILTGFPVMKYLSQSESQASVAERLRRHHSLAQVMMNWILGSNRAVLVKLNPQQNMTLFGSRHQFRLIMQSPEREKKFQELKRQYGASWVFHGSRPECWYSIMRNGLKNASSTSLQVNGSAYGSGIYLSQVFSTSSGYSQLHGSTNESKMSAHMAEEFIDPEREVRFIAVCEVIEHDLKKPSNNIWVQPHEDHVVTRFLIVYTHGHTASGNIQLNQPASIRVLNECLALTEM